MRTTSPRTGPSSAAAVDARRGAPVVHAAASLRLEPGEAVRGRRPGPRPPPHLGHDGAVAREDGAVVGEEEPAVGRPGDLVADPGERAPLPRDQVDQVHLSAVPPHEDLAPVGRSRRAHEAGRGVPGVLSDVGVAAVEADAEEAHREAQAGLGHDEEHLVLAGRPGRALDVGGKAAGEVANRRAPGRGVVDRAAVGVEHDGRAAQFQTALPDQQDRVGPVPGDEPSRVPPVPRRGAGLRAVLDERPGAPRPGCSPRPPGRARWRARRASSRP